MDKFSQMSGSLWFKKKTRLHRSDAKGLNRFSPTAWSNTPHSTTETATPHSQEKAVWKDSCAMEFSILTSLGTSERRTGKTFAQARKTDSRANLLPSAKCRRQATQSSKTSNKPATKKRSNTTFLKNPFWETSEPSTTQSPFTFGNNWRNNTAETCPNVSSNR